MAHNPTTFKVDNKKKTITIYTNIESVDAEQGLINFYLSSGYAPKLAEKKPSLTVDQMRKDLKDDSETLAKFNEAYEKSKSQDSKKSTKFSDTGFAEACEIYNKWKKKKKAEVSEESEASTD